MSEQDPSTSRGDDERVPEQRERGGAEPDPAADPDGDGGDRAGGDAEAAGTVEEREALAAEDDDTWGDEPQGTGRS